MKEHDQETKPGPQDAAVTADSENFSEKSTFPWKVAGGGVLALLLIWFVLQNSHPIQVNLLWWSGTYPMVILMAAVAIAAILVWESLTLLRRRRMKRRGVES